ncbi:MAG: hypothetical protein U1A77_15595 [Pirellulales bacterium]
MNASFRHSSRFGALAVIVLCACSVWAQQREDSRCPLNEDPGGAIISPDEFEVFDLVPPQKPFEPGLTAPEGSPECPRPDGLSTDNGRPDPKPVPPGEGGPKGQAADDFGETPRRPVGPGADQPDGLVSNLQLMPTYRGNDGGAFYLRKIGQEVFLFGEHPVHDYAMVFAGTLSGSHITGEYWDVPKGTRALQGTVRFRVEDDGERLVVTDVEGGLGLKSLNSFSIPVLQLPPAIRPPGFYATSAGDLDGAWRSSQSSLYVREVGENVVGWEEMHFGLG